MTGKSRRWSVYQADDVYRLLDYEGCIGAMRAAMMALSADEREQPLRSILPLAPAKLFALMPGVGQGARFGAKVISVCGDPAQPGRSIHSGTVVLFDGESGEVRAIADAGAITHIRTACATAVATDALARKDAQTLVVFGCGAQADSHIGAISLVRKLTRVLVWGRVHETAVAFARRIAAKTGLEITAVADGAEAASAADIICTVTGSLAPVLYRAWVRPGTHINAVGSSHLGPTEIDSELVRDSRFIVDSRRSALVAAAEFRIARDAGLIDDGHIVGEIGEVLLGRVPGRQNAAQITLYKSLGHIVQDLAAVAYIDARAGFASAASPSGAVQPG